VAWRKRNAWAARAMEAWAADAPFGVGAADATVLGRFVGRVSG
jgi:hypothetical protein